MCANEADYGVVEDKIEILEDADVLIWFRVNIFGLPDKEDQKNQVLHRLHEDIPEILAEFLV